MTPQPPSARDRAAASKPTAPGWYECRHKDEPDKIVRWFDGKVMYDGVPVDEGYGFNLEDYTDFIGPLVPAREPGERERVYLDECAWCGKKLIDHARWTGLCPVPGVTSQYWTPKWTLRKSEPGELEFNECVAGVVKAIGGTEVHVNTRGCAAPSRDEEVERLQRAFAWLSSVAQKQFPIDDTYIWTIPEQYLSRAFDLHEAIEQALDRVSPPLSTPDERSVENG